MHASSAGFSESNQNIISFSEYRRKRFGGSDGDGPTPGPGALGARPAVMKRGVKAVASSDLESSAGPLGLKWVAIA
jgi:hypothetical protein